MIMGWFDGWRWQCEHFFDWNCLQIGLGVAFIWKENSRVAIKFNCFENNEMNSFYQKHECCYARMFITAGFTVVKSWNEEKLISIIGINSLFCIT